MRLHEGLFIWVTGLNQFLLDAKKNERYTRFWWTFFRRPLVLLDFLFGGRFLVDVWLVIFLVDVFWWTSGWSFFLVDTIQTTFLTD